MDITPQIFDGFKRGELDDFYREAWTPLMSYAARYLGNLYSLMAEDCVQEAILSVYHSREKLVSPVQMKAFLFTTVHNRCVSLLRKNRTEAKYLSKRETAQPELWAAMIEQETLDMLYRAIQELPEKYRQIFEVNYEQGLKNADAAAALNLSLANFNKRKARMITLLRDRFRDTDTMQMLITVLFF
ncbi:MAG: sigma-70 family RNA polymerase sigma factor [Prevotella sp.]|nr:sigma-70 family RNA polymerase sigma factor [Prevotella sp.]MDY4039815.1 sigma-70 family RNA polymerase sigma factor [Prevotella sp.]